MVVKDEHGTCHPDRGPTRLLGSTQLASQHIGDQPKCPKHVPFERSSVFEWKTAAILSLTGKEYTAQQRTGQMLNS